MATTKLEYHVVGSFIVFIQSESKREENKSHIHRRLPEPAAHRLESVVIGQELQMRVISLL